MQHKLVQIKATTLKLNVKCCTASVHAVREPPPPKNKLTAKKTKTSGLWENTDFNVLRSQTAEAVLTFSLSEDTAPSTAGFWGQSIQQSQTASRRSPHRWRRPSYSWRRSSRPEGEDGDDRSNQTRSKRRPAVELTKYFCHWFYVVVVFNISEQWELFCWSYCWRRGHNRPPTSSH